MCGVSDSSDGRVVARLHQSFPRIQPVSGRLQRCVDVGRALISPAEAGDDDGWDGSTWSSEPEAGIQYERQTGTAASPGEEWANLPLRGKSGPPPFSLSVFFACSPFKYLTITKYKDLYNSS